MYIFTLKKYIIVYRENRDGTGNATWGLDFIPIFNNRLPSPPHSGWSPIFMENIVIPIRHQ